MANEENPPVAAKVGFGKKVFNGGVAFVAGAISSLVAATATVEITNLSVDKKGLRKAIDEVNKRIGPQIEDFGSHIVSRPGLKPKEAFDEFKKIFSDFNVKFKPAAIVGVLVAAVATVGSYILLNKRSHRKAEEKEAHVVGVEGAARVTEADNAVETPERGFETSPKIQAMAEKGPRTATEFAQMKPQGMELGA